MLGGVTACWTFGHIRFGATAFKSPLPIDTFGLDFHCRHNGYVWQRQVRRKAAGGESQSRRPADSVRFR